MILWYDIQKFEFYTFNTVKLFLFLTYVCTSIVSLCKNRALFLNRQYNSDDACRNLHAHFRESFLILQLLQFTWYSNHSMTINSWQSSIGWIFVIAGSCKWNFVKLYISAYELLLLQIISNKLIISYSCRWTFIVAYFLQVNFYYDIYL